MNVVIHSAISLKVDASAKNTISTSRIHKIGQIYQAANDTKTNIEMYWSWWMVSVSNNGSDLALQQTKNSKESFAQTRNY